MLVTEPGTARSSPDTTPPHPFTLLNACALLQAVLQSKFVYFLTYSHHSTCSDNCIGRHLLYCRAPQMLALSQDLSSIRSRWLDQVIVPHLAAQSLGVGEYLVSRSGDSPSRMAASGEAHFSPTRTPPEMQTTYSRSQVGDPHEQPSGCHSQCTFAEPDHQVASKAAETEGTAKWWKHGAETANAPFRDKQRTGDTSNSTFEASKRRNENLDIQAYIERLRAVLGTAVGGLFSPQACHFLVELVVSQKP